MKKKKIAIGFPKMQIRGLGQENSGRALAWLSQGTGFNLPYHRTNKQTKKKFKFKKVREKRKKYSPNEQQKVKV